MKAIRETRNIVRNRMNKILTPDVKPFFSRSKLVSLPKKSKHKHIVSRNSSQRVSFDLGEEYSENSPRYAPMKKMTFGINRQSSSVMKMKMFGRPIKT